MMSSDEDDDDRGKGEGDTEKENFQELKIEGEMEANNGENKKVSVIDHTILSEDDIDKKVDM